eukprot:TRINITY_DN309_c0_g1_i1.p4 TRINITY_DN309_c0_g1~~TRINITY_DN309_c0_g1_i1.p4  ORF type:complete len:114 (+),score=3.24 TRINITY_DN309_c0_g1_i1:99-440(+)
MQNSFTVSQRKRLLWAVWVGGSEDVAEESLVLGEGGQVGVRLSGMTDESSDGEGGVLSLDDSAISVNVWDGDLDRGVIAGGDQAVGGRALAWKVDIDDLSLFVLHVDITDSKR